VFERNRPAAAFGGSFRVALNAPPYGRLRATLQPPPKAENNGLRKEQSPGNTTVNKRHLPTWQGGPFCSAPVVNFHSALDTFSRRAAFAGVKVLIPLVCWFSESAVASG
jgi:hypothetical protein